MRKTLTLICTLAALAACSKSGDNGTGDAGPPPPDAPTIGTDRTQLLFGLDYGLAVSLGTKPANTLQIFSKGKQDLMISDVEIVSGTAPDGGALNDVAAFSKMGPDKTDVPLGESALVQVVFDSTVTGTGLHGAILRISSNDANNPTVDIPMMADVVTPLVTVVGGSTDITIPDVTIYPASNGNGGRATGPDGGTIWQQVNASGTVLFENTGTAQLQFQPAVLPADAGLGSPFVLCSNNAYSSNPTNCQPGPLPDTLDRLFPDGGVFGVGLSDGGFIPAQSELQVVFQPSAPGSYEQHVVVDSNATNTPEIVFTVHGNAVPGDAGF